MIAKSVIITGAADGLGRATSIAAAKAGYSLLLVDIDMSRLGETEKLVRNAGGRADVIEADVSDSRAVQGYVSKAMNAFGRIDGLFSNAGIRGAQTSMIDYPEADFDRIIAVNLKGVFLGLKYVLPVMVEQGFGSIVNTASIGGIGGTPHLSGYAAAKHGVIGLTKTAALEFADSGVRVNAVLPGLINTKMSLSSMPGATDEERAAAADSHVPMGYMGQPRNIADAVIFLLSDQAQYITGTSLIVDGGITATP